jgi:hypothetical protein
MKPVAVKACDMAAEQTPGKRIRWSLRCICAAGYFVETGNRRASDGE